MPRALGAVHHSRQDNMKTDLEAVVLSRIKDDGGMN
jgi:hypothetical protein